MKDLELYEKCRLLSNCLNRLVSLGSCFQLSDVDFRIRAIWQGSVLERILNVDFETHRSLKETLDEIRNLLERNKLSFWKKWRVKRSIGKLESQIKDEYGKGYHLLQSSRKTVPQQLNQMEQNFDGLDFVEVQRKWNRISNRLQDSSIYPYDAGRLHEGLFDVLNEGFREIEGLVRLCIDRIEEHLTQGIESRKRLAENYTTYDITDSELSEEIVILAEAARNLSRSWSEMRSDKPSLEKMKAIQHRLDRLDIALRNSESLIKPVVQERLLSALGYVEKINVHLENKKLDDLQIPRELRERLEEGAIEYRNCVIYKDIDELLTVEQALRRDAHQLLKIIEEAVNEKANSKESILTQINESNLPESLKKEISSLRVPNIDQESA